MATVFDAGALSQPALRRPIGVFAALVLGWSLLCTTLAATSGVDFRNLDQAPGWVWAPLMALSWGPALAALLTHRLFPNVAATFGWRRPPLPALLAALAIPTIYALLSYAITWGAGLAKLDARAFTGEALGVLGFAGAGPQATAVLYGLLLMLGGTLAFGVFALGEDLGYSGFLIPALAASQSYSRVALLTGLIWSSAHYVPIVLLKNFTLGTHPLFALAGLTLALTALSFVLTWLRLRTGSIWSGVLLHAIHNAWFFLLLEPITAESPLKPYVSGEHGLITIALLGVFAALFWLRRGAITPRA